MPNWMTFQNDMGPQVMVEHERRASLVSDPSTTVLGVFDNDTIKQALRDAVAKIEADDRQFAIDSPPSHVEN